jgi:hypothetical protein
MGKLYTNAACKSLRASGLDAQSTYPILSQIESWVKHNGPEWTVNRLKAIKQSFIHRLAGQPDLAKNDLNWIKHGRNGPKGPFSRIFKMTRKPQKAISALMVYTSFLAPKATKAQIDKFYQAAETKDVEWDRTLKFTKLTGLDQYKDRFTDLNTFLEKGTRVPVYREAKRGKWSFREVSPAFQKKNLENANDREEYVATEPMSYDAVVGSAYSPIMERWFKDNVHRMSDDYYKIISKGAMEPSSDQYEYVGIIANTQEPGYKMRVYANPFPVYQLALSRMGNKLYDWLRDHPNDATFDQEAGVQRIQDAMKRGDRLMSIDLSNATDSFPLEYTMKMLYASGEFHDSDLRLFEAVSRGKFFDPMNEKGYTTWTKGQALGVFPSFAAFAASHHSVVEANVTPTFYCILGDDLVIDRVAGLKLLEVYDRLGVKISLHKSLDSPILNEFGGRLITQDKIIIQPKWRDISDRSFLDMVRNLGPTAIGYLKPRQQKVVKIFSEIPQGLHPYALGWNPKGLSYNERVESARYILQAYQSPLHNFSSKTARSLGDLKTQIRYHHSGEFHIDTEPSKKAHPQFADVESRILQLAGVTRVSAYEKEFKDWTLKSVLTSDPRGISTLESAEKMIREAGALKRQSEPQSNQIDIVSTLDLESCRMVGTKCNKPFSLR